MFLAPNGGRRKNITVQKNFVAHDSIIWIPPAIALWYGKMVHVYQCALT